MISGHRPDSAVCARRRGGDAGRQEIARIELPPNASFEQHYMQPKEPVVITNLFEGEPIRGLTSRESVATAWGDMTIQTSDQYDDAIGIEQVRQQIRSRSACAGVNSDAEHSSYAPAEMTIDDYLRLVDESGGMIKPRIAFEPPAAAKAWFENPPICAPRPGESEAMVLACLVGTRGSFSQLHFDKDGLHGLLYQVYGRKRVAVIAADSAHKLAPFTQFSRWCLQNFTDADRSAFLRYTGGREAIIGPGEAIYLPAFCWHFVDYLDDCWSLNIRFRRSAAVTDLLNAVFPDMYAQGVGTRLSDLPVSASQLAPLLKQAADADGLAADRSETLRACRQRSLARDIYNRICPDLPKRPYAVDIEGHFPPPLPHFLDPRDPRRPRYR